MPSSHRRFNFRLRNGFKAFTALILATVLSVSGLQYQANALTLTNGNCSADVNVTSSVSVFAEGNYCYVAFKGTSSTYQWTPPAGLSIIDLLVVAGGGGGGTRHAAGGGAGGLISTQSLTINGSAMNITVGAGGAGAVASAWSGSGYPDPSPGQNSVVSGGGITTKTAVGGGQGASDTNGGNGGSGGGGTCCSTSAGTGTSGQGNNGSAGTNTSNFWAGGAGGGAGGLPTSPNSGTFAGARGGAGATVSWVTSTAAAVGALAVGDISGGSVYFASGGGGGLSSGTAAAVQPGGGSAGTASQESDVTDAKANTGGGGGGSGLSSFGSPAGGDGGSGVVVLRYAPQITVTFNNNGGSGTIANQSISASQATALSTNTFTRTGYTFTGWNTAANGTGTAYTNSQSVSLSSSTTLYAVWRNNLMAYEPFTGTATTNLVGGSGSGSSGLSGNWILVNSQKHDGTAGVSNTYTSESSIALPKNTSFTLPGSNTAATGANWTVSYSAKALATPISFDSAGTYYYSFINHIPDTYGCCGMGMLGLLSGLPSSASDTGPWSLFTGGPYGNVFGIDYGNANRATWVAGQTRGTTDIYSALSSKTSAPTTSATANFVLVKIVTSASGNDQISLRAFAPSETMPTDDSTITWDVQYATAITGSATYMSVQSEYYGVLDEFRIGYTYDAVTGAQPTYTVTYSYDSATGGNSTSSATYVNGATALTLPTPTKTGYTFGGWYSEVGLTNQVGLAGASYSPTSTGTLYAKWTKNSNTVTFNSNGGTGSTTTQSILTDTSTALTANSFTKTGYTFNGWNTAANGSGTAYTNSHSVTITGGLNLYAQWSAVTYTVTYNYNSATGGNSVTTGSFTSDGTAITLPVPTKTGYTFGGWFESSTFSGSALSTTYSPTSTLTIYAKWTANTYTVTYNYNGATGANSTVSDSFTVGGSVITLPAPSKTGYTFGGWFEASALTGSALATTYAPTSTRTIYAKWTPDTNTVTFNNNGGSGSMSNQSITSGVSTALTANSMTKTGYSFAGWATSANGSVVYADSEAVTLTAGFTLFAKWTANTNTVTFNANDGSGSPVTSSQSIVSGSSAALTSNSFSRTGYTFAGWNTAANGSGTVYANSASVTVLSNITLYAQWTAVTYTVTYNKNGASGNAERASESYTSGATAITLPTIGSMTKTGYTFDGWSETNGGSKISATYTPTASITLYARWVAASFSITYNNNAASSGSPSATSGSYTTGGTAITLATQSTMARTGYTFAGWSTTINDNTTRINNSGSYTITAPVILYALWTAVDYSVTYSTQGSTSGAAPTDATVFHIGDTAVVKANTGALVKTGYTFSGWTVASDGSGTVLTSGDTVAIASSNVTLYPKWTANTYTVTFNVNGASGAPAGYSSGSSPFTESYTSGTSGLTLAAVGTMVKTGYDFAGWSTTPSGGAITNTGFTTTIDKTLFAVWNLKSINYTYFRGTAGGTSLTGSHIANFPTLSAQSGLYGSVINLDITVDPTITVGADGYQFMGWNDGNSIYSKGDAFTLGSSAATFTAEWVRLYEVRYAKNGGTGVVDVDPECAQAGNTCLANQNITLHVAPSRPGYTFTGWKDQSNQAFAAGAAATITNTSYLFYAQWQAINYTMAFNSQGGSTSPAQLTKNISDTFTLPSPGTKTGYTFSGWFDGTNTYGVGANYTVGTASKTFAALWTANVYTVTYNWNGGTGTSVPDVNYTYGSSAITLPTGSTHTRDGYTFAGWATSQGGTAISGGFTPTADTLLYARWVDGSYTVTLNARGGTLSQSSYSVSRGSSISLPAPTRTGFTFDGWYEDSATTLVAGQASTSFAPTATATLHAKWVQNSLAGVNPAHINSLTSITVTGAHTWSGTHSASGTGASLSIPNGALPNGTVVKVSFIEDLTRPRNIIDSSYAYYSSVIVHWLTGTGDSATVPVTAANKPLTLTMTNPAILPGARVFMIINGVATEAAEATQAGQVTIEITQDPEFVIAATKPSLPTSITATAVSGSQATVSWAAPTSTGGAPITGYTVTANPGGATCSTTAALTCDVVGLSSGVSYSYSVAADNAIGSSGVRSTTVTYVPPAPTPVAPANTVPAAEVTSGVSQAPSVEVVASDEVVAEAEVPSGATTEEPTDDPTSNPVAERIRKGDTGIAAYVIGLGVAGGLLVLVLVGLLIILMRRRSNS